MSEKPVYMKVPIPVDPNQPMSDDELPGHTYNLKVISVVIVQSPSNADVIYITFDAPSNRPKWFPHTSPTLRLETQADYGLKYVTECLGIPRTLVKVQWHA